jgi:hypothetical protein
LAGSDRFIAGEHRRRVFDKNKFPDSECRILRRVDALRAIGIE